MEETDYDPVLLDRIEQEVVPLIEILAKQTLLKARNLPGRYHAAPVGFVVGDEVRYTDRRYEFRDFHGEETVTDDEDEILDLVVTAWVTHVMSELEEGDQYGIEDIVRILASHIA